MAGEIQLNSTTMATESSGSITAELDTIRPNTTNGSLTLQGDSSNSGVTGLTINSSGVVNTTTAKVTNIQATSGQSLTIKDEDGNAAITVGTDNTAAGYLSLNFGSYHGGSGGAGSGTLTGNTLDDYEEGTWTPSFNNVSLGNGSVSGTYRKIGSQVFVTANYVHGSTSTISGDVSISNLPFTASNFTFSGTGHADYPGVDAYLLRCNILSSSTTLNVLRFNSAVRFVTASSPNTIPTNGSLSVQITYHVS
jgi:hypothetical protein